MLSVVLFVVFGALALTEAGDDETMAMKFLNQYHYLSTSRSGNHDVDLAIRHFQRFAGLKVTGRLDSATIRQMKKPRCGMPDDAAGRDRVRRYKTGSKWRKTRLTYYIQFGRDLPQGTQERIFQKALQYWADVSALSFSRTNSPERADLKISFGYNSHGGVRGERRCGYPFDGAGKVLAHAFFPEDGRAHFDEAETYTDGTSRGTNLLWVATHEFGHALGLDHSEVRDAIMYPYYTGYVPNMRLHSDDIAGIQYLYGYGNGGGGNGGGGGGFCQDDNAQCNLWEYLCYENNYVIAHCKKTCGRC